MGLLTRSNASALISAITCLFYVGGTFGSLAAAPLADRWGRKVAVLVGSVITLFATALQAGAINPAMFIASRFIGGFGSTIIFAAVPVWITEVVPPKDRGMLIDIHPILINVGYCISSWIGVGFYFYDAKNAQWRAPIAIGCLFPILSLVCVPFVPESPRYLLMKGEVKKSWTVIKDLHSRPEDVDHQYATAEFTEIKEQIRIDRTLKTSYWQMLKRPSYRKRVFIGCGLIWLLETSGTLVINIYGTVLYRSLGYGDLQVLYFQAGWVTIGFTMNTLAILVVERMPRPTLMFIGFLGCLGSLIGETAIQARYLGTTNKSALAGGVAMLYTFVLFFAFFLDGSTFFYIGEIFPNHLRAQGMTLAMLTLNLSNVLWQSAAPTALENIGWKFYLIFIISTTFACVIVPLTFPDTRNKPLEEIGPLFGDEAEEIAEIRGTDLVDEQGATKRPGEEYELAAEL
ncbi:hypothetical protein LTS17_001101 [Exophiala oligosperma]